VTNVPPVCILAGGLGTRLGDRVASTPKPLLDVAGKPFLLHQLDLLARHDVRRVVVCVGYLGAQIERRIGRRHADIAIEYSEDGPELAGTLGAIRRALPMLGERFLVLYGDTYLRLDYAAAATAWERSGRAGLMTVYRNDNQWDSSNVELAGDRVARYDKTNRTAGMHWIDYGLGGLTSAALELAPAERDLSVLQTQLAEAGELFAYQAHERFYEIGTPAAIAETDAFLRGL
jgi:NDP-sugar pyrophosphorylase family protein